MRKRPEHVRLCVRVPSMKCHDWLGRRASEARLRQRRDRRPVKEINIEKWGTRDREAVFTQTDGSTVALYRVPGGLRQYGDWAAGRRHEWPVRRWQPKARCERCYWSSSDQCLERTVWDSDSLAVNNETTAQLSCGIAIRPTRRGSRVVVVTLLGGKYVREHYPEFANQRVTWKGTLGAKQQYAP
jgi:hypothetical protein